MAFCLSKPTMHKAVVCLPMIFTKYHTCNPTPALSFSINELSKFMPDISQNAVCSRKYTAHCLHSTAIQALNEEGFKIRHFMYMSGHRYEASVRSYNRDCSMAQKQHLSYALAKVAKASSSAK